MYVSTYIYIHTHTHTHTHTHIYIYIYIYICKAPGKEARGGGGDAVLLDALVDQRLAPLHRVPPASTHAVYNCVYIVFYYMHIV